MYLSLPPQSPLRNIHFLHANSQDTFNPCTWVGIAAIIAAHLHIIQAIPLHDLISLLKTQVTSRVASKECTALQYIPTIQQSRQVFAISSLGNNVGITLYRQMIP